MIEAPSAISLAAWLIASLRELCVPPSENESGVTFKMPITWGEDKLSSLPLAINFISLIPI